MKKQKSNKLGFTLLELSVVLVIMGVLLIPALNFMAVSQKSAAVIETRKELRVISNALGAYYKENSNLPCPANIALDITHNDAGTINCGALLSTNSGAVLYGAVPVKDLGLSFQYLLDSWGNKYSYYVRTNSTTGTMTSTTDIYTRDQDTGVDDDGMTYVVISHGEDGIGSYGKDGTEDTRTTTVTEESNNIHVDNSKNITTSSRLTISKGGVNDVSISSSGADLINEIVGHNSSGDYFAGNFRIMGGTGNVGIGTTSPSNKLDVRDGDIEISDTTLNNTSALRWTSYSGGRYTIAKIVAEEKDNFNGDLRFYTRATDNTVSNEPLERMVITEYGNVGIGGTNPGADTAARVFDIEHSGSNGGGIRIYDQARNTGLALMTGTNQPWIDIQDDLDIKTAPLSSDLGKWNAGTQIMTIETDGDVGIGTNDPSVKLHIMGTASTDEGLFRVEKAYGIGYDAFVVRETGGNAKVGVNIDVPGAGFHVLGTSSTSEDLLRIEKAYAGGEAFIVKEDSVGARVGINTYTPESLLHLYSGTNDSTSGIKFTATEGATASHRLSMYSSGGSTFNFKSEKNGIVLKFLDHLGVQNWSVDYLGEATLRGDSNAVDHNDTSDKRYKKNIVPIKDILTKVNKLVGVFYHWRIKEFPHKNFSDGKQIGLIAQEVEKIFPEIVKTNEEGYKTIAYGKLTPILVEAVKELSEENKQLNKRMLILEAKMERLMKANSQ